MHYNRVFLIGTAITDPIKGKGNPDRYWFRLRVKRDDNPNQDDLLWVTGLVSNLDNFANNRIRDYVHKGKMVLVEGVVQSWQDKDNKPYLVILAKLVRVELWNGGNRPNDRLLSKIMRQKKVEE